MGRECSTNLGEEKHICYWGKPEGKRPVGRSRHRLVNNIKIDLGEIIWSGIDWIGLIHDRDNGGIF
jgi:hypothetical protein